LPAKIGLELHGAIEGGPGRQNAGNWGKISDAQAPMHDQRIKLSELEMDLSGSRRG
jgi:hypothetical protein